MFWKNIDPLTPDRQFCDRGSQYRAGIFYHNADQERLARATKRLLEESGLFGDPIVTEVAPATTFYPAEEYHQDYYQKNPLRYRVYRFWCGRDGRLKKVWGDSD